MDKKPYVLFMNESPSILTRMISKARISLNLGDTDKLRKLTEEKLKVKIPDGVSTEDVIISNMSCMLSIPRGASQDECIMYLHGGGYTFGGGAYMRRNGINFADEFGVRTLSVEYRLAPENKFPAALDDALSAYEYLLERYSPSKIVIIGDSAGGGLAFSLVHKLKQIGKPLPKAIVAFSPWTDLLSRGESHITNKSKDLIFSRNMDFASEYASPDDYENPLVSPIYGSFNGFPPILIIVGGDEILLSDSLDLAEKAHKEGVNVEVQVWNRMFHVFPVFGKSVPEAARALRYVTHFIDRHMTGS